MSSRWGADAPGGQGLPPALDVTFEALVFDWDGTAVPDRRADAAPVRERVEQLSGAGVHLFVVSGTNVDNIDGQLLARPNGPGQLFLCCNRGSEVFEVGRDEPVLVVRRNASTDESAALDRAADRAADVLRARGLVVNVVRDRLNRRKIDLIPEAEWADPNKVDIARLLRAVTERLWSVGMSGLGEVVALSRATPRTRKAFRIRGSRAT